MKMLNIDNEDSKKLGKISREEAFQFLEEGLPIICQTTKRDFYQIDNMPDLNQAIRLEDMGVYDTLKFYVK